MTKFILEIETDNDTFADGNLEEEVARILRKAAAAVEDGIAWCHLYDINGNRVGSYSIDDDM